MGLRNPWVETRVLGLLDPVTRWLVRAGVHPNALTTAGFLVTCSAGLAFHLKHVPLGGFLVLLGGAFDVFDGRVARASGLASKFGSFYDSTLDRISEVVVFLGILSLYNDYRVELGDVGMIYTVMLAISGSLMVSYTRARAEGLGIDCKLGLMQRAERVVLVGIAALFFGTLWEGLVLKAVLIAMAILTNFTAFQRIVWVYRHTRIRPSPPGPGAAPTLKATQK
ncbi:MAG TPA: CDP-alcohol phosphatidyltransferase family protein [Longimicrobiaceae bacterium]|nr:CDP-alcohol phosphatidyltransferase family protein [Longimicrobiaceae bacterium]